MKINKFDYACPICLAALYKRKSTLECFKCKRSFPIISKIPIFLPSLRMGQKIQKKIYEEKAAKKENMAFELLRDGLGFSFPRFLRELKLKKILDKLKIKKETKILDVGCFTGHFLNRLSVEYKTRGYGVDLSFNAIKQANFYRKFGNVFFVGEATILPFANNFFDGVTSLDVLEHINNKDKFILEILRVLKPKGWFLIYAISNKYRYTLHWFQWIINGKLHMLTEREERGYGFWAKGGHTPQNLVDPEKVKSFAKKFCSYQQVIPFHALFTIIYDIYLARFLNGPFHIYLKFFKRKRVTIFERCYLFIYKLLYELLLKVLSALDFPLINKGYGNGFFFLGTKSDLNKSENL